VDVLCISRPDVYLLRQIAFHFRVISYILAHWKEINIVLCAERSFLWFLPLRLAQNLLDKKQWALVMDTRSLPMHPINKETWKEKLRRRFYIITAQIANRYADGRLAITQRIADALHIPADKLWGIWPSGADEEHFVSARTERVWPSSNNAIRLIYHGSMHYERNLMALCRAVMRAIAEGSCFELQLVGNGTERVELENYAAGTNGHIAVFHSMSYNQISKLLANSHVGVLPFPDEEKFRVSSPIKLFEYIASGMPILATRIACHTDVVGDGDYVFWAETSDEQGLFDALQSLWNSREKLSEMGRRAAVASKKWTWAESAQKLKRALEVGMKKFYSDGRWDSSDKHKTQLRVNRR
jgi:glycosyltransferase involved in cell wall biosynthesis